MGRKKPKTTETIKQELTMEVEQSFNRWHDIHENGCFDPFWEDGCNLNLVRNHILYFKRRCEEELSESEYPDLYYAEVPPKVDNHYMANSEKIRRNARDLLANILAGEDYRWLHAVSIRPEVTDKQITTAMHPITYVHALRAAIKADNLVDMRRYIQFNLIEQLEKSHTKVSHLLDSATPIIEENGQMTLLI